MSIEGDSVRESVRRASYTPVTRKSVSTRLALEAHTRCATGSPISFAYRPARMSPKLPVGTTNVTGVPFARPCSRTRAWYAA